MLVKEVLEVKKRQVVGIVPTANLVEAMKKLIENRISCLPVVDDRGQLVGIVSDKDIFRTVYEHQDSFRGFTVREMMTSDVLVGVVDDDVNYVAGIMTKNRIRHLPIMDDGKLVGLISVGDVVAAQMEHMVIENRYLKLYIEGTGPHH